jgi:ABC-type transport system substrate-binding protein
MLDLGTAVQGYLSKVGINAEIDNAGTRYDNAIMQTGWKGLAWIMLKGGADFSAYLSNTFSAKGVIWANSATHPDEIEKIIPQIVSAPNDDTKKQLAQQAQKLIFEKYCILNPIYQPVTVLAKYPAVQNDGIYLINTQQWTPEDTYKKK